jgi:hypothetical protein
MKLAEVQMAHLENGGGDEVGKISKCWFFQRFAEFRILIEHI